MKREYLNKLENFRSPGGPNRRMELTEKSINDSGFSFGTILIEDYDRAFQDWVEKNLGIVYDGKELPTVSLFTNQRFGEYMQTWKDTDDKKNLEMNFKVITRENNPQPGTMYEDIGNVPENKTYLVKRIESIDKNGRPLYIDYRMKQPYCVDIEYHLSIVANKFRLINLFNEIVNEKFKAINSYLDVKGNYVSMTLDDVSDESEYQIDDRQYYSQSYDITVRGYLVREDDWEIVERPKISLRSLDFGKGLSEIEETGHCKVDDRDFKALDITVEISSCNNSYSFTIDEEFVLQRVEPINTKYFRISKNGEPVYTFSAFEGNFETDIRFLPGDILLIDKDLKIKMKDGSSKIILHGYNPHEIQPK